MRDRAPLTAGDVRLWSAFSRSVRSNLQAEFLANLIRVGGLIVLARALQPRDFGLLRILIVLAAIAGLIGSAGFPEAVIQRRQLLREHEWTAWWLSLATAGATATALGLAAPWVERVMEMAGLAAMIRLICIPIFIEGSSAVANARLQRELRYGALAVADVMAELAFVAIALALLYLGFPRVSLPGGLAARAVVRGTAVWIAGAFIPRGLPRMWAARDLWRFAAGVFGGQALVIASQNADYVMVGRLLGEGVLGYYSLAWDLLRFIPERLYRVVGRVTLPAFSAIQDRQDELARRYRALIAMAARLLLPAMAILAVTAPGLIVIVYGGKWLPAATPLRLLTAGLALLGLRLAIGSVYYAKGHPSLDILLHGLRLIMIVATVGALARYGLAAVCAGMSAVEALVSIAGQWIVCRLIAISMSSLAAAAIPGFLTALWCCAGALTGRFLCGLMPVGELWRLGGALVPAAAIFCWRERTTVVALLYRGDGTSANAKVFG